MYMQQCLIFTNKHYMPNKFVTKRILVQTGNQGIPKAENMYICFKQTKTLERFSRGNNKTFVTKHKTRCQSLRHCISQCAL